MRRPLCIALVIVAALGGSAYAASTEPPGTLSSHTFPGTSSVGALFLPGLKMHTCTASVVASPAGNLLVTAAHCMMGTGHGYTFAPGYHDGVEPYGLWTVSRAYGTSEWISHQAPQSDFAFLIVEPREINGKRAEIQQITGANQLAPAPKPGASVTVDGYAAGRNDKPVTCAPKVYFYDSFPSFNCNPFVDGTSGSPWLEHNSHGWFVTGVIGGLHQGGCESWTSYSASFGPGTLAVAQRAISGGKASVFPIAGGEGCTSL